MKKTILLFLASSVSQALYSQQPGDLDLTFDTDGKTTLAVGSMNDWGYATTVQPDGKILVAGSTYNGSNDDFSVVRCHANGSLDNTFGVNGKAIHNFSGYEQAYSIALQQDGKIVVGGRVNINSSGMARLNADGSVDTNFGTGGLVTTSYTPVNQKAPIAIQSDGKIILGATANVFNFSDFALLRYLSNGTPDNTFGTAGTATVSITPSHDDVASIALQSDGKIVAGGAVYDGTYRKFCLARFNADGSLDTGFNGTGSYTVSIGSEDDYIHSVLVQADGKILATGSSKQNFLNDFALLRLDANGTPDNSFGTNGKVTTSISTVWDIAYSTALQSDGKIVAAGMSGGTSNDDFSVVRYNTNGTLDNSFSGDGKLTTPIGTDNDIAYGVAIQPDGKIVAAGSTYNGADWDFALARYHSGMGASVSEHAGLQDFRVSPNPVERNLTIDYSLTEAVALSLHLYDITGRHIQKLMDGEQKKSGNHRQTFDLIGIPAGNYLVSIISPKGRTTIKIQKLPSAD